MKSEIYEYYNQPEPSDHLPFAPHTYQPQVNIATSTVYWLKQRARLTVIKK